MIAQVSAPIQTEIGQVDEEHPWPGLEAFDEDDQAFFHGRDRETVELSHLVLRDRATLLYSLSGLGKTSLLRAGLFPRLRKANVFPIYIRLHYTDESADLFNQVKMAILLAAHAGGVEIPPLRPTETLWEYFHRQGADFWGPRHRLLVPLLVFDQFEEIFTLGRAPVARPAQAAGLLPQLVNLIKGSTPASVKRLLDQSPETVRDFSFTRHPYKLLFSLREDYLPDFQELGDSFSALLGNYLRLHRMNGEQARDVVIRAGGHLISDEEVAEQVTRVVAKAEKRDSLRGLEVDPALLSVFCRELNNKRIEQGLPAITASLVEGHRTAILTDFYERSLADAPQTVRDFIEKRLVNAAGQREMLALKTAQESIPEQILDDLVTKKRLLRIEERAGIRRVELIHDLLTDVIRVSRGKRQVVEAQAQVEAARKDSAEKARQLRKSRFLILALAISLVVMIVLALLAVASQRKAEKAEEQAQEERRRAQSALASFDLREADRMFRSDHISEGLAYLARALRWGPDDLAVRSVALDLLLRRSWHLPVAAVQHATVIYSSQFSPDGKRFVTASSDHSARVWDVLTGEPLGKAMYHAAPVFSAHFSPNGRRVVTASFDKTARIWDAATGEPLGEPLHHAEVVYSAQFSPDSRYVVTGSKDATARLWDARSQRPVGEPMRHQAQVYSAQFSPDGQRVITASWDHTARIWDGRTGRSLGPPLRHGDWIFSAEFSPDGNLVLTASGDSTARLWEARTGRPVGQPILSRPKGRIRSARFSPNGQRIVTASWNGAAQVWDTRSGRQLVGPMQHEGRIHSAEFSPDGLSIVTASGDGTARIWDAQTGLPIGEPLRHRKWVYSARFSRDGTRVVTASEDGVARVWRAPAGRAVECILQHGSGVHLARFSSDGRELVTASADGTARLWDASTGQMVGVPMVHGSWISSVTFAPDGNRLATVSADRNVRLWEVSTGTLIGKPMPYRGRIRALGFSPDGKRLYTTSAEGTTRLWEASSGDPVGEELRHAGRIEAASFSGDGKLLVTVWRNVVRVWELESQQQVQQFVSGEERVHFAELSPDGKRLIMASPSGTAQILDIPSGKLVGEDMHHEGSVDFAHFSPDGERILTVSNQTARLWDASNGESLGEPMFHQGRILSAEFSPEAQRIVTASADHTAKIWDAVSGEPIGGEFRHANDVRIAQFSPDGQQLVTASADGTARIWDVLTGSRQDAGTLASLIELIGGLRVDERDQVVPVLQLSENWDMARRQIDTSEVENSTAIFVRWFFADPRTRTISPLSKITVPEYIQKLLSQGSPEARRDAASVFPGHPLLYPSKPKQQEDKDIGRP